MSASLHLAKVEADLRDLMESCIVQMKSQGDFLPTDISFSIIGSYHKYNDSFVISARTAIGDYSCQTEVRGSSLSETFKEAMARRARDEAMEPKALPLALSAPA